MKNLLTQVNITNEYNIIKPFPTPGSFISVILKNIYVLSGIILFALVIFGGFSVISGAGENDPKKTAAGKKAITSALIGFLIIFASYWIIRIIEVITGINILGGGGVG